MNLADVAPQPAVSLGALACAVLALMFLTSTVILLIVLRRRNRRNPPGA